MFESNRDEPEANLGRRLFLSGACAVVGGAALFSLRRPHVIADAASKEPVEVTIVQFSDAGKRLAKVKIARVVKSEDEWRKQGSPGGVGVTRDATTWVAYT